ncbi:MAG: glycogen/starch synthase, partial [Candidatus Omnitrophica bacterium]|nr:glycogen/starch synthase [Candidatus Omnitrophota bacterium]
MKIVICSSEVVPFAKTGGLADVAGALPLALENLGQEVIVVMPKYSCVDKSGVGIKKLKPGISSANIGKNVKVYFIENEAYYNRPGLYGEKTG